MFQRTALQWILLAFYKVLSATWRVKLVVHPALEESLRKGRTAVLAHWHGDELALLHLVDFFKVATMTSHSADGQLIDFFIRKLGGKTSKGSSSRGGTAALKGLVRHCRQGRNVSIGVDGPKGPYHEVKNGVFQLSRLLNAPIFPFGVTAKSSFVFEKSWNKTFLPYPFSRITIVVSEPMPPISRSIDPHTEELAAELSGRLDAAANESAGLNAA